MTNRLEIDACEMSSSEYVSRFAAKKLPFVALPVFVSRVFRHGFIVVNRRFVSTPKDLAGKRIGVLAEFHQIDRGRIDREMDDHAATATAGKERLEDVAMVFAGYRKVQEANLTFVKQAAVGIIGCDDDEFLAIKGKVPLDQRQGAFADRTEADHDDWAVKAGEQNRVFHSLSKVNWIKYAPSSGRRG